MYENDVDENLILLAETQFKWHKNSKKCHFFFFVIDLKRDFQA